jgi:hypothetical protein
MPENSEFLVEASVSVIVDSMNLPSKMELEAVYHAPQNALTVLSVPLTVPPVMPLKTELKDMTV